ncbi:MAG: peptidoglycan DD-metalloendopeptidase family protein, partial [Acidimicrobiales bacterium]
GITALTLAVSGNDNAAAQEVQSSDWAPFVGELPMWCTKSTGGAGPCANHHDGWAIDIDVPFNDPIYAAGPGVVGWTEDGCSPTGGDSGCNSRAGNYVAVDHGDRFSRYLHLASFAEGIEIGAVIRAGQLIGFSGQSGTSGDDGAHLHYDEIAKPLSITKRIFFGPMLACHGNTAVQYPDILGYSNWQQVPFGTLLRNDGYACLGGVNPKPPPPPPPINPTPGGAVGLAFGDFNNDNRADMIVGAPGEAIRRREQAGTTAVVYGSSRGLGSRTETLRQRRGLKGAVEAGDLVGAAIATGDFDCDGFDDVAVGAPREDVKGVTDAGAVLIAYGGPNTIRNRSSAIYQGKWIAGQREAGDLTGAAIASGDFDGDGCADLAIGAPREDVDGLVDAGAVMVIHGQPDGFNSASRSSAALSQGSGLDGFAEAGDLVGATLAAGDFNCDGYDDLAVGVPSESIDAASRAGAVSVIYGSANGLTSNPGTLFQSSGIAGILEAGDRVGASLATGDFNADNCADLAVGAPGEDLVGGSEAGAVSVVFGSPQGLSTSSVHFQQSGGLRGTIENGDLLGAAVAAGDFNCDGFDDLAVGVPGEDIGKHVDAGWVGLLYGSATGMNGGTASLYQRKGGLPGANETNDQTGTALAADDVNNDGCDDLAIGAPGEAIGSKTEAGRVLVVMGAASGRGTVYSFSQTRNLPGRSESGDLLGGPGVWRLLGLSLQ